MNREAIALLIERDDFRPYRIITSAGVTYDITDAESLALGKTELFYYFPRSDRSIHIPYTHIFTIEESTVVKKK